MLMLRVGQTLATPPLRYLSSPCAHMTITLPCSRKWRNASELRKIGALFTVGPTWMTPFHLPPSSALPWTRSCLHFLLWTPKNPSHSLMPRTPMIYETVDLLPVTPSCSTEAEFLAAVATAKHARHMRAIMTDLGFPPKGPTVMCCDNQSAINMINARVPTERSRHIDIQHFAIQDWKESGAIVMEFISGVINPSDDLTKPLGWVLHDRHARRIMGHH